MARASGTRRKGHRGTYSGGMQLAPEGLDKKASGGDGDKDSSGASKGRSCDWPVGYEKEKRDIANAKMLMNIALSATIPLWAERTKSWPSKMRWRHIRNAGMVLAEKGDILAFGSPRKGVVAEAFNTVACGIGCSMHENPDAARQMMEKIFGGELEG